MAAPSSPSLGNRRTRDADIGAAGIQHLVENSRHQWICALARVVTAGAGGGCVRLYEIMVASQIGFEASLA